MKRVLTAVTIGAGLLVSAGAYAQNFFGPQSFSGGGPNWAGPEVGVQGAYGWGNSTGHAFGPGGAVSPRYNNSPYGGLGGIHGGYNWQFGRIVLGLDADVEGGDIFDGTNTHFAGVGNIHSTDTLDFDASGRGKIGYAFGPILPYATGGVAFGRVHDHFDIAGFGASSDSNRVGYTVGAGVDYALNPNWSVGAEYRYTDLGNHTTDDGPFIARNNFSDNVVRAVLTYRFAPPPPPPPMAAPMPAAAPAPAPAAPQRTFLVFFDFDRYNLTPDARQVVDAAVASYKATGSARLEISGYTDLAGTQAYNLRLSQRRADAVANDMMRQGVPKNVMDVKWFGKEHPRVPTPNGVREPQNRRVEIVME